MKNLLIYLNPNKNFNPEHQILVKIQIDNSLSLGWKKEDIILVTNFPYEYSGVKSFVVDDRNFCSFRPLSTKTVTVAYMLETGIIEKGETYWVHDFDAYQLEPFDLKLERDAAFTTYGWSKKWCLGSYFFKDTATDIFKLIKNNIYVRKIEDERALVFITKNNIIDPNRYEVLNITYNVGKRNIDYNLRMADKPVKVLHFHPNQELFKIFAPEMPDRLLKIFNSNGIK